MDTTLVRADLSNRIKANPELIPLLIRFAWHCSGTFDAKKRNGGSNGATIRLSPERDDPENRGFEEAFKLYDELKIKFNEFSYADLYILGGYVALQDSGGPKVPFQTGRVDFTPEQAAEIYSATGSGCPFGDGEFNPNTSRLPAADLGKEEGERKTIDAMRGTFTRMGFNDEETVALMLLGHQYGQCHKNVTGYEGFWYGFGPNVYNNAVTNTTGGYSGVYKNIAMFDEVVLDTGKRQYETRIGGKKWMMLIADMALHWDPVYKGHWETLNNNRTKLWNVGRQAWKKLTELGCDGILTPELVPGNKKAGALAKFGEHDFESLAKQIKN